MMTETNSAMQSVAAPMLLPQPSSLHLMDGIVALPIAGIISQCSESCFLAEQLADSLSDATGLRWNITRGEHRDVDILLTINPELEAHGYTLTVSHDVVPIVVEGRDAAALRDGVQTLRQLIAQYGIAMPCLEIADRPAYAVRSYSLDVTRGRVPTLAWIKTWIDKLCLYKYNQLQLYIEHTGKVRGLSESWRGTSPLTSRDLIELDGYCRQRGIELVPSISTFGHHYMTLRTRSFLALGEFPEQADRAYSFIERQEHHTMNINHPDALTLSQHLIDAYLDVLSSTYFNIGGDETFDLGKGRSRDQSQGLDVPHMYASYVERLCDYVERNGHRAMLWGDIAVEMPEILDLLPKNIVILNWLYAPDITGDKVALVAKSGARQYVCAAVHSWNSVLPHIDDGWNNISRLARYGMEYRAEGFMVTDWGDYGHINDSRMSIPAMIYGAQEAWNPGSCDLETLDGRIARLEYGDVTGSCVADMKAACQGESFSWENIVHYLELDDGTGSVNTDVYQQIRESGVALHVDPTKGLTAVRRDYLRTLAAAIETAGENDTRLTQAKNSLVRHLSTHTCGEAHELQPWLIAIQGQRLFNRCGKMLLHPGAQAERYAVAEALEIWFEQYAEAWRTISRESELRRIATDIWRVADLLRAGAETKSDDTQTDAAPQPEIHGAELPSVARTEAQA